MEVLDIDEVAIQSVLYLHPIRGVEVFVREEGDSGKENVEDGRGENAPLLDRHIHTEEWGLLAHNAHAGLHPVMELPKYIIEPWWNTQLP